MKKKQSHVCKLARDAGVSYCGVTVIWSFEMNLSDLKITL